MRRAVALAVLLACGVAFTASVSDAGPWRDWWAKHRSSAIGPSEFTRRVTSFVEGARAAKGSPSRLLPPHAEATEQKDLRRYYDEHSETFILRLPVEADFTYDSQSGDGLVDLLCGTWIPVPMNTGRAAGTPKILLFVMPMFDCVNIHKGLWLDSALGRGRRWQCCIGRHVAESLGILRGGKVGGAIECVFQLGYDTSWMYDAGTRTDLQMHPALILQELYWVPADYQTPLCDTGRGRLWVPEGEGSPAMFGD